MIQGRHAVLAISVVIAAAMFAAPAAANMLLPLYYEPLLFGALLIVPVIVIESLLLHLYIREDAAAVFATVIAANLVTVIVGLFVPGFIETLVYDRLPVWESGGGFMGDVARSLGGTEHPQAAADITAALFVHLVFFLASFPLEAVILHLVLRRRIGFGRSAAIKASLLANAASYTFLSIVYVYTAWG